jgi:hypothetical protein
VNKILIFLTRVFFWAGDYAVLYNALSTYDWSSLYNETSADAAVDRLNVAAPSGYIKKHTYPTWFSGKLKVNNKKNNYFYRHYKKCKADCFYDRFSFHCKLIKTTIKTDRFRWLKSVDENLKSHPKQFWKYVSQFRKRNTCLIYTYFEINDIPKSKPHDIAEALSKYFQSVYISCCSETFPFTNQSTEVLSSAPVSNSDVHNATKLNQSHLTVNLILL